jgi:competence ComEA-like helix-hairpin-helix protein
MKRLLAKIQKTIGASVSEARAFVVVGLLIILVYGLSLALSLLPPSSEVEFTRDKELEAEIKAWLEQSTTPPEVHQPSLRFSFNPNHLSVDSLELLGIDSRIAQRIHNYRSKGGQFRQKDDLLKIYGFPVELYAELQKFVLLENASENQTRGYKSTYTTNNQGKDTYNYKKEQPNRASLAEPAKINLNTADTALLKKVRGIGSVLSNRIVKFREKLGGFVRAEQLNEVYGLSPEVAEKLLQTAYIDQQFTPSKLSINRATEQELAAHPYISWSLAKKVVAYRAQHGPFKNPAEVMQVHGVDEVEWGKLGLYITFE